MSDLHNLKIRYPLKVDFAKQYLVLSTCNERIKIDGIDPSLGVNIITKVNSGYSVQEIVEVLDADDRKQANGLIKALKDEAIISSEEPEYYSGKQMSKILLAYYEAWNQELFSHQLWTSLAAGRARETVVDGWLAESYHFIRGANARLCYASSYASDQRIRGILAHHYVEEYDHYKFFADSLSRRGLDVSFIDAVGPLPSTVAVINMTRRAAREDYLAYAACSGLLESTGSDANRARSFYQNVAEHYDKSQTGFVDPMLKHIDLDEEYEHGNVMCDVFDGIPYIEVQRADNIISTVVLFTETLNNWFTDIQNYYHSRNPSLHHPDRPARFISALQMGK